MNPKHKRTILLGFGGGPGGSDGGGGGKGPCPHPYHGTPLDPDYDPDNYGPDQWFLDQAIFPKIPPAIKPKMIYNSGAYTA